jgi:hypothetical protein
MAPLPVGDRREPHGTPACGRQEGTSWHPFLWATGGNLMAPLPVGDRREPHGTPAYTSLDLNISPSTEILNCRCKRN